MPNIISTVETRHALSTTALAAILKRQRKSRNTPMDLYKNKYRIASARLKNWDYGSNGAYFITICTHHRIHYFGKIISQQIQLTGIGQLAEKYWLEIPNHFPFVELGNFVIMPNHMHGVLIINKPVDDSVGVDGAPGMDGSDGAVETRHCLVSTGILPDRKKTISSIVGSYKSVVTKNARIQFNPQFAWQSRFHDHIIRNRISFDRIQQYIANNPENWDKDKFKENEEA